MGGFFSGSQHVVPLRRCLCTRRWLLRLKARGAGCTSGSSQGELGRGVLFETLWWLYPALHDGCERTTGLVGLKEQVFFVGYDWGAMIAWNPTSDLEEGFKASFGNDYYFCRFQEHGEAEEDFACADTATLMKNFFSIFGLNPP
ncbi:uncharacterized protein LOC122290898 [Carya illinoinensis]|uniref:uncharacterized protein LOC122290898 n=1 Tax=Carya illinoinensis TaxID=32201 RepID=UPI001C71BC40|nr:uncharacterized protein LOC122290898 [Carya illinoinensis]